MGKRAREGADPAQPASQSKSKPKKPRKHVPGGAAGPSGADGNPAVDTWQQVEAGEDFHTGLDEDGFMGLEVMQAPQLYSSSKATLASAAAPGGGDAAEEATLGGKAADRKAAKAAQQAAKAAMKSSASDSTKQKGRKAVRAGAATATADPAAGADAAQQPAAPAISPGKASAAPAGEAPAAGVPATAGAAVNGEAQPQASEQKQAASAIDKQRKEKLAALKEAARLAAVARDEFVMPEGLSRKEQRQLLAKHKREKHKAAMKHKKAKIADRRRKYKLRRAAREGGDAGSGSDSEGGSDSGDEADGQAELASQRKGKPKKAAAGKAPAVAATPEPTTDVSAWDVFGLHPGIQRALAVQGFATPTPIQEACLMPAIRGRRDIIGAAQTGSGKTLAFGLPIIQQLLAEGGGERQGHQQRARMPPSPLRALVLLPTRELALQVEQHLRVVAGPCGIGSAAIVGGLSAIKQERVLSKQPAIVAATPGRLWDLMQDGGGASRHLTQVGRLDFLVLDEADRMVQQGHYKELGNIIEYVVANRGNGGGSTGGRSHPAADNGGAESTANASDDEAGSDSDSGASSDADASGGEGPSSSGSSCSEDGDAAAAAATPPETETAAAPEGGSGRQGKQGTRSLQAFVFSATLTLPSKLRRRLRKGGGGAAGSGSLDALMDAVPFGDRPKVVDLTGETQRLAAGLSEAFVRCDERQRDEFLYYMLVKHPGRTLVFVNAVSATRRLAALLGHLGVKAVALHASQQQRQRLKALDRFKKEPNGVLVATDVAARGLDVPDVRCVVHYQVPASADLYVHRSGRTARAAADGAAVALVTPGDSKRFDALQAALSRPAPPEFPVDERLLPAVHERVGLALRLDGLVRSAAKRHADKSWMRAAAADLGIEVDSDGVASDGEIKSGRKRRELLRRMKRSGREGENREEATLRRELALLLAEPLRTGFSQKYFTGGAAGAAAMLPATAHSTGEGGSGSGGGAQPGEGMQAVVAAAAKLHASRTAAADDMAAKQAAAAKRKKRDRAQAAAAANGVANGASAGGQGSGEVSAKGKKRGQQVGGVPQDAGDRKQKQRRAGGGAAVPAPLGREAGGQDALAALRKQTK